REAQQSAAGRSKPDVAGSIAGDCGNPVVRQSVRERIRGKVPVLQTREPADHADPQTTVRRFEERLDVLAGQLVRVGAVEYLEPLAVEPDQSFFRAEPDVAVPRL